MEEIRDGKSLVQMDEEKLFYVSRSVFGNSEYIKSEETMNEPITIKTEDVIPYWKQRVDCKFCGSNVSRAYYAKHKKSKNCMIYQNMNDKIRDLVLKY